MKVDSFWNFIKCQCCVATHASLLLGDKRRCSVVGVQPQRGHVSILRGAARAGGACKVPCGLAHHRGPGPEHGAHGLQRGAPLSGDGFPAAGTSVSCPSIHCASWRSGCFLPAVFRVRLTAQRGDWHSRGRGLAAPPLGPPIVAGGRFPPAIGGLDMTSREDSGR